MCRIVRHKKISDILYIMVIKIENLSPEEQKAKLHNILEKQRERCKRYKKRRYDNDPAYREKQINLSKQRYIEMKQNEGIYLHPEWKNELEIKFNQVKHLLSATAQMYVNSRFFSSNKPNFDSVMKIKHVFNNLNDDFPKLPPGVLISQINLKKLIHFSSLDYPV